MREIKIKALFILYWEAFEREDSRKIFDRKPANGNVSKVGSVEWQVLDCCGLFSTAPPSKKKTIGILSTHEGPIFHLRKSKKKSP